MSQGKYDSGNGCNPTAAPNAENGISTPIIITAPERSNTGVVALL